MSQSKPRRASLGWLGFELHYFMDDEENTTPKRWKIGTSIHPLGGIFRGLPHSDFLQLNGYATILHAKSFGGL